MNTSNSRSNDSNKFIYQFTNKLNLKNPNKNMALANLSIYYTWKNIKSEYNNNKFKISASTLNDTFDLSLWYYYRDELTDETNDDNGPNKNVINSKLFKYKTSITGSTCNVAATAEDYDANKEGTK